MPYRYRRDVVEEMLPHLQLLAEGKLEVIWEPPPEQLHIFIYRLREALAVSRIFHLSYPEIARAAALIRLKVENGSVRSVLNKSLSGKSTSAGKARPQTEQAEASHVRAEKIIFDWLNRTADMRSLSFSLETVPEGELERLYELLDEQTVMLVGDERLILSEKSYHIAVWGDTDSTWKPDEPPAESKGGFEFLGKLPVKET